MITKFKRDPNRKLTQDELDLLDELENQPIDYSDIPEQTPEELKQFRRVNELRKDA